MQRSVLKFWLTQVPMRDTYAYKHKVAFANLWIITTGVREECTDLIENLAWLCSDLRPLAAVLTGEDEPCSSNSITGCRS